MKYLFKIRSKISVSLLCFIILSPFVLSLHAENLIPDQNNKGKWGFVNERGEKVINYDYDEVSAFVQGRAKVKKGDKYGYINENGKEIIKIKFSEIGTWTDGKCKVAEGGSVVDGTPKDAKWGYIGPNGEYILKTEYSSISPFTDGVAVVIKDKKYGYIDEKLHIIIPPRYAAIGSFNEYGLCWVNEGGKFDSKTNTVKGGKYGIYNKDGRLIVPCKYVGIGTFSIIPPDANPLVSKCYKDPSFRERKKELMKTLQKDYQKKGFTAGLLAGIGGKGLAQDILEDDSDQLRKIEEAEKELNSIMSLALPSDEIILKNECGEYEILAPEFIDGQLFSELDMSLSDMIAVRKSASNKMMKLMTGVDKEAMNAQGKAFAQKFNDFNTFTSPKTDKPGIITSDGRILLEAGKYPAAYLPSGDIIPIVKWGKNISSGKDKIAILQINYIKVGSDKPLFKKWIDATMVTPFKNGYAVVTYLDKSYIISDNGERVSQTYDLILPQRENIHVVKRDGKYGMIMTSGKEVIQPSFDFIAPEADGLFLTRRSITEPFGYLNSKGEFALKPQFIQGESFAFGSAKIKTDNGWGLINTDGSKIVDSIFDDIKPFSSHNQDVTWVKSNGSWKLLDNKSGTISFETAYADVDNFNDEGHAVVMDNTGKFGLISKAGEVILPVYLSSPKMVERCVQEMKELGMNKYSIIDVYRFNARNHTNINKNKLSDIVPSEFWDY